MLVLVGGCCREWVLLGLAVAGRDLMGHAAGWHSQAVSTDGSLTGLPHRCHAHAAGVMDGAAPGADAAFKALTGGM